MKQLKSHVRHDDPEIMAAVTLELKKRAKQTKSVYIDRTAVTWKLKSCTETAPSAVTACSHLEEFWQPTFHFSLLMLSESEIVTYAGPKIPDRKVPFKCTKTRWRLHRHPSRHVAIWKNFDKSAVIGLEIRPLEKMLWFGWATKQGNVNAAVDFSWNVKWVIYSSWKVIRPPAAWGELSTSALEIRNM